MKKQCGGFTLLEVMIVVAILVLIAVIAVPNYMKSRQTANDALCTSNMDTLYKGVVCADLENDYPVGQIMDVSDIKEGGYVKGNPTCPFGGGVNYTFHKVADGEYYIMCPGATRWRHSDRWKDKYYQGFDGTPEGRGRHAD